MSTRASGFDRIPADLYETPPWVVDALAEHVGLNGLLVWEPACGKGKMMAALREHGADVVGTDLHADDYSEAAMAESFDFTTKSSPAYRFFFNAIITNPPYGPQGRTGERFIESGLERIPAGGLLALLLPVDFDSARTRARFFRDCPEFAAKIVLTRRIAWFDPPPPKPGEKKPAGPSANHAWFVWERSHVRRAAAVTLYAPSNETAKSYVKEAA